MKMGKAIIQNIKNMLYDFFHPSVDSLMREFAIVEKPISPKDYERCMKFLEEWEDEMNIVQKTELLK